MLTAIPSSEMRNRMAQVLAQLRTTGSPCLVTKNGKAVAALLSIEAYNQLLSDLEDRMDEVDEHTAANVVQARKEFRQGQSIPLSKLKR